MREKSPSPRKRWLPHIALAAGMIFAASGVLFADETFDDSIAIISSGQFPQRGSAFVIAVKDRTAFLATAKHVVEGQSIVRVTFPVDRSKEHVGELIQNDSQEDLALLRVRDAPPEVTALAIVTDELQIGDEVTIAGFPRRTMVPRYSKTALSSQEGTRLVFFGEVDPGTSGGPVLKDGHVVGLVVTVEGNYPKAIPGATLRRALASWLPDLQLPVARFARSIIQGRVFWIDEDGMTRLYEKGVPVRILETGESTTTDESGFFRVPAPPYPEFRPGQKVTFTVGKQGWVIRYPFAGIIQIPDRRAEIFQVELVPQGSKVLLSDGQLTSLLEQAARQPLQSAEGNEPPTRYLADWAARNGFDLDEVRREIHRWSDQILKHSDDAYQRGLAELAKENYLEAEQIFVRSARTWQDEMEALAREEQRLADRKSELKQREARDLELAASSAYRGLLFDRASEHYHETLALFSREDHQQDWARLQNNLGTALSEQGTRTGGAEGQRLLAESVSAFRSALEIRTRDLLPQDWAMTQNNLGTVLGEQGIRTRGEEGHRLLAESVSAYRSALEIYTQDLHPQDWAMTQNNLGTALSELGIRTRGEEGHRLLAESVSAYYAALEVHIRDLLPQDWAMTQNNLGTALKNQGTRAGGEKGRRLLAESVSAYRSALEVRTRDLVPQDWAIAQNNLGTALRDQGILTEGEEGHRLLAESVSAYRSALEVYTRDLHPQQWATTLIDLGNALSARGARTGGEAGRRLLAESVSAYRSVLGVYTRDLLPQQWATTQSNLGIALSQQGIRTEGEEGRRLLAESVSAYRSALGAYDRDLLPEPWATTQNNLGNALQEHGVRTEGEEGRRLLAESVSAYRSALEVYDRDLLPQPWATTQNNLGNALSAQGTWTGGEESRRLLAESVSAYRSALEVYTPGLFPKDWAMTQNNLGNTLSEQGILTNGEEGLRLLAESVSAYRTALEVHTRDLLPQLWAMTQNNLGTTLKNQGVRTDDEEGLRLLTESVSAYRSALEVYTRDLFPQPWAMTKNNLGIALSEQGIRTGGEEGTKVLTEAVAIFADLLTTFPGEPSLVLRLVGLYQDFLFEFPAALQTLRRHREEFAANLDLMQVLVEVLFTNDLPNESAALGRELAEQENGPNFSMLKAYEAASFIVDGDIPGALGALSQFRERVSTESPDLQADWEYRGTLHYLEQSDLESRDLLIDLFRTLESENREDLLEGLRRIQAQLESFGDGSATAR